MAWTEDRVKLLKKLWQSGKSTVEIGRMLGISKNAVVGKVHRLELTARPSPIKPEVKPRAATKQKKPDRVTLMDLKLTSCRWPMKDPRDADFHFCGAQSVTGKPYCQEHCKIAYTSLKELSLQNALNKNAASQQQTIESDGSDDLETAQSKKKSSAKKPVKEA